MSDIIKFKLTVADYVTLAKEAFEKGDIEKNIAYLYKALSLRPQSPDLLLALGDSYASIGAYNISNNCLYIALSRCKDEQLRESICVRLAMNFIELEKYDVADYYMRDYSDEFDFDIPEREEESGSGLFVSYPRGDAYYDKLIDKAYEMINQRRIDEALKLLDEVPKESKMKPIANHVALVCLMMKEDIDSVIANGEKMIEDDDSLAVPCSLATAYLMEDRREDAERIVDEILKKDYEATEDVLMLLLPLLVNMDKREAIVKYVDIALKTIPPHANIMQWKSQALYRLGRFEEAKATMLSVKNIFREYEAGDYYLQLYDSHPATVEYSIGLPYEETMRRFKKLDAFFGMAPADAYMQFMDPSSEIRELLDWAFLDGNDRVDLLMVERFSTIKCDEVREYLRSKLILDGLSFEVLSRMLSLFLTTEGKKVEFDVVAQHRLKNIRFVLPNAYYSLPTSLFNAVSYCIADIIYTDETPNVFLHRLTMIVNSLIDKGPDGVLIYDPRRRTKIARLTSMRALVGVILQKVYEDDEDNSREETIERYSINPRTFDKYEKIVFGDDDGE